MENVKTKVEKNILTITVDMSKDFGPSKSGKTNIVASTGGFAKVADVNGKAISISMNVISK